MGARCAEAAKVAEVPLPGCAIAHAGPVFTPALSVPPDWRATDDRPQLKASRRSSINAPAARLLRGASHAVACCALPAAPQRALHPLVRDPAAPPVPGVPREGRRDPRQERRPVVRSLARSGAQLASAPLWKSLRGATGLELQAGETARQKTGSRNCLNVCPDNDLFCWRILLVDPAGGSLEEGRQAQAPLVRRNPRLSEAPMPLHLRRCRRCSTRPPTLSERSKGDGRSAGGVPPLLPCPWRAAPFSFLQRQPPPLPSQASTRPPRQRGRSHCVGGRIQAKKRMGGHP